MDAAMAVEADPDAVKVVNRKRHSIAVEEPAAQSPEAFLRSLETLEHNYEARVVEDYQYELEPPEQGNLFVDAAEAEEASLDDVVAAVGAAKAWPHTRGEGVTIAVVDTGVDGTRPEFPLTKRVGPGNRMATRRGPTGKGTARCAPASRPVARPKAAPSTALRPMPS